MPSRFNQTFPSRFARSGFGLVELMITIAILAILAAMAFPSFNYMIRGNRVSTEANDFLSALNYARNESITRTRGVTICAADTTGGSTPTACGGSTVWTKGWMVFIDDTAGATTPTAIDSAAVLRTWIGNTHNTLLPDAAQTFVRFNPRGQARSDTTGDVTFTLKPVSNCANQQQRSIVVTALGRSSSSKVDCT